MSKKKMDEVADPEQDTQDIITLDGEASQDSAATETKPVPAEGRAEFLALVNRQHKVLTLQTVQELELLIDKYFPA